MSKTITAYKFGQQLITYAQGLKIQEHFFQLRRDGNIGDTLLLLQHTPVFTIGKRGSNSDFRVPLDDITARGIHIFSSPRGGEVTFHGPGQLVAYPILNLRELRLGARNLVERMQASVVATLAELGINSVAELSGATGVWVGPRKICAVGVRISQGVSSHGLALNVTTDLDYFNLIVPCGMADREVTSVALELSEVQQRAVEDTRKECGRPFSSSQPVLARTEKSLSLHSGASDNATSPLTSDSLDLLIGQQEVGVLPKGGEPGGNMVNGERGKWPQLTLLNGMEGSVGSFNKESVSNAGRAQFSDTSSHPQRHRSKHCAELYGQCEANLLHNIAFHFGYSDVSDGDLSTLKEIFV